MLYDKILTNPPFGVIKHFNKDMFKLHARRKENLFLELCLQNTSERVAIIVPDSLLGCTRDKPIRKWILGNFGYRATISLPRKTFWMKGVRSSTQTKTSIMIIDKIKPAGNYQIFMAIIGDFRHSYTQEDLDKTLQGWKSL